LDGSVNKDGQMKARPPDNHLYYQDHPQLTADGNALVVLKVLMMRRKFG